MSDTAPVILWIRRDLRLIDNPALVAAVDSGVPVLPLFIRDPLVDQMGAAPKWRLDRGLASFDASLRKYGSRLILRQGAALDVLRDILQETGAKSVFWGRDFDPRAIARDTDIKSALKEAGVEARSFPGQLLFEPQTVQTKAGGFYRVYSPFWRAVRDTPVGDGLAAPKSIPQPVKWPQSDTLDGWALGAAMRRGADVVSRHARVGEAAALDRLNTFLDTAIDTYKAKRDYPAEPTTSGLSENLTYGEISPRTIWYAGQRAMDQGAKGAEHFLKELVWREFAYHLAFHTPHMLTDNWREGWDAFAWSKDGSHPNVLAWKQGRTGIRFVDAAMREMYVTGTMHNRARMIVASYLTKHLMTDWRIGLAWFADCLTDWDPAANAMGWQWVAGSGPDAAPYFRIFNPDGQLQKFDADQTYVRRWLAEPFATPSAQALSYFEAIPKSWGLTPDSDYPEPVVPLDEGRRRALAAYEARSF